MSADLSVRNPSGTPLRLADALLRSLGGSVVSLRMPGPGTGADSEQIGLASGSFVDLPLGPAVIRKTRDKIQEGAANTCEVLLSASAVAAQVSQLNLDSADALFAMATGVVIGTKLYLMEAVASTEAFGQAYVYRIQLREAMPEGQ